MVNYIVVQPLCTEVDYFTPKNFKEFITSKIKQNDSTSLVITQIH